MKWNVITKAWSALSGDIGQQGKRMDGTGQLLGRMLGNETFTAIISSSTNQPAQPATAGTNGLMVTSVELRQLLN
jgi:hypothetical protein